MLELECATNIYELVRGLDKIKNKNYLSHGIHPYPAKFIPQIPACILETYSHPTDVILDPFCGSGTSLLEAMLRSRKAIGVDLNPIATLISKVKTHIIKDIEQKTINNIMEYVDSAITAASRNSSWGKMILKENDIPDFYNRNHWFQQNVVIELLSIKSIIETWKIDSSVKDFLRLCMSAIIVKVSNQESDTRWKAIKKDLPSGFVLTSFRNICIANLKRLKEVRSVLPLKRYPVRIYNKPVADLDEFIQPSTIDLIITSPPYLNSYDYYLYHKLRMFWLGYDHKYVQAEEIGSRNKHCDNNHSIDSFIVEMSAIMKSLWKVLKEHGKCVFVVGDSIYRGNLIDMAEIYQQTGKDAGFKVIDHAWYDQRKYSRAFTPNLKTQFKRSHVLVFSRPK